MLRKIVSALVLALLVPMLVACGNTATAQQEPPTPTPLPPDPALERETYTVQRGTIERRLEINGRVTPVDLVRLSFHRSGRVEKVHVARDDAVKAGDVIAELQQDEAVEELRQAEDTLVQAQRDLESARKQHAKDIQQKELQLADAQENLRRLLPGGDEDPIRKAQEELEAALREARATSDTGSEGKTNAEYMLLKATETLQDAQKDYSEAYWENDWVVRYGTDPDQPEIIDEDGKKRPNKLTDEQKEAFAEALVTAERALREAERGVVDAQRDLDEAREKEVLDNSDAAEKVQEAQRKLDALLSGKGSKELLEAQRAVRDAQLALEEARAETFNSELKAVENAQRDLEKAQKKVADGRVIAPQDGQILALAVSEGDEVQEFQTVVELADPSRLEVAADLGIEQMRQLAEGQPVEIALLTRPDVRMPAMIRRLPAPFGSGGSGAVQEQDRTTRFQIADTKNQQLNPGAVAKIYIVLEQKEDVLWLPPEAIRSFEGRRFVIVREGERERRVTVKIGIETAGRVEILEGLKEGDLVVGQ